MEMISPDRAEYDEWFQSNPPPDQWSAQVASAKAFVEQHHRARRQLVLVTSGGTTVPLEARTVRFLDNFSSGHRGAASAESFLDANYAVIFVHREHSLLPYSRHFSHTADGLLDFLTEGKDGQIEVEEQYQESLRDQLRRYRAAKRNNRLLLIPYTTIIEYLWLFRMVPTIMQPLGSSALIYLAAAVSDFFIPRQKLAEHKIQSSGPGKTASSQAGPATHSDKLILELDPVPKFLSHLVSTWAPSAMITSFKLETDSTLLISKAKSSLARYRHHLVIGNVLATRRSEVVFVSLADVPERWIRVPQQENGDQTSEPVEIEAVFVPEVIKLHERFIADAVVREN